MSTVLPVTKATFLLNEYIPFNFLFCNFYVPVAGLRKGNGNIQT